MLIWHPYFCLAASENDVGFLYKSNIFSLMLDGPSPPCNFVLNEYEMGYFLCDRVYLRRSTPMKAIHKKEMALAEKLFTESQKVAHKDVKRAFVI